MTARITLQQLELKVRLGFSEAERASLQPVWVTLDLTFSHPPKACSTDDLKDTICYDTLISNIKKNLAGREFRLLEYLAQEIVQIIKQESGNEMRILVSITKKPAIPDLLGGATFTYGD